MGELVEQEILAQAIQNLNNQVGFGNLATVQISAEKEAMVTINGVVFTCEIKRNVTNANFNSLLSTMLCNKELAQKPYLLVAQYIYPALSKAFSAHGINVLDRNGNCCIKEGQLFICIHGEKSTPIKEKVGRAFQEAGLRLIFFLLNQKEHVNLPYRTIQQETGLSLGTIKSVIESLIGEKYILVTQKGRFLKNRNKLLNSWVTAYNQNLKPKKALGKFTFITKEKKEEWMNMQLPEGMYWGGECAAHLIDGFLTPGSYEIYTRSPLNGLLRTGYLLPKEDGEITVYGLFWNDQTYTEVPLLVVYADLMGSGNSRCLEAAQRILQDEYATI